MGFGGLIQAELQGAQVCVGGVPNYRLSYSPRGAASLMTRVHESEGDDMMSRLYYIYHLPLTSSTGHHSRRGICFELQDTLIIQFSKAYLIVTTYNISSTL